MRRAFAVLAVFGAATLGAQQQPTNDLPNPYKTVEGWAKLPAGRVWGSTSAVDIDKDGKSIYCLSPQGEETLKADKKAFVRKALSTSGRT